MSFTAIVVAAGSGSRAGGPKQWTPLGGKPVVRWSVEAFLAAGAREVVVVVPAVGGAERAAAALAGLHSWRAVAGGAERSISVARGMDDIDQTLPVLVHDAARPLLESRHVHDLLSALKEADAAAPALPMPDTVKEVVDARVKRTVDRSKLWRAQTPQAFRPGVLSRAYYHWPFDEPPTDDLAVVEEDGGMVRLIPGDPRLMKLTYPEDFAMAEALVAQAMTTRVGMGFDAHRFGPGQSVWLCGVEIAHGQGLVGHSDADAGLHALTDALLGAVGEGDIGDHFPPTDPQWKGAASDLFLIHAHEIVRRLGGRVVNVDVTLICERPKVKPHRQAMRERVAALLDLPLDAVSIKATTTEAMGFTGRGEGLAAQAVATVELVRAP